MFTFEIARAPLDAPVVRENLQTLDGLSVTEAIRLGHVKTAPSTVKACRYTQCRSPAHTPPQKQAWPHGMEKQQDDCRKRCDGQRRVVQPQSADGGSSVFTTPDSRADRKLENGRSIIVRVEPHGLTAVAPFQASTTSTPTHESVT